jgi:hypothetical protein
MTIVYEGIDCLKNPSLSELVSYCRKNGHEDTFTNPETDLTTSVLYHLKLLKEGTINKVKHAQSPVVREV